MMGGGQPALYPASLRSAHCTISAAFAAHLIIKIQPWNKVIYTFCERMLLLKGERLCSISSKAQWLVAHCVPMPFCAYGWG